MQLLKKGNFSAKTQMGKMMMGPEGYIFVQI